MQKIMTFFFVLMPLALFSQHEIVIDGNFQDWESVSTRMEDPANDEHDTEQRKNGIPAPQPVKYSDVDILEVKFTHDRENLYGYVKARGVVGRTSHSDDPSTNKGKGRYYYIITIDVDNNDSTGYFLEEGGYWPNSGGYDMNMEVEFYNGEFNTGHYIHHDFLTEADLVQGSVDLHNYIIRLGPGTYDNYLQWVVFPDSSIIEVSDRGPVYQGIIEVAVSPDGHEAEMKAPMWGFFWDENGEPIISLGDTIDISFSLEGSGELSESALEAGYNGKKTVWGSDTADPIEDYVLEDQWTGVRHEPSSLVESFHLWQNYPNPFNPQTTIRYSLNQSGRVVLKIYDLRGREVATLVDAEQQAGTYAVVWNGRNRPGGDASSGVYFYRLQFNGQVKSGKMILMR